MEEDWRIDSSPASLGAYRDVVSNALYGGTDPAPTNATRSKATVRALQVAPSRAIVSGRRTAVHRAKVVYRLSHRARVQIAVRDRRGGLARPGATVTLDPRRSGRIRLSRLVGARRLHRGSYRVVARAMDRSGSQSRPRRVRFRVV
jgi:hypothetical protein